MNQSEDKKHEYCEQCGDCIACDPDCYCEYQERERVVTEDVKVILQELRAEIQSEIDQHYGLENKRHRQIMRLLDEYEKLDQKYKTNLKEDIERLQALNDFESGG